MTCSNLSLRVNLAVSVLPKTGPWPTLQPSEQLWQQIAHSYTKAEPSLLPSSLLPREQPRHLVWECTSWQRLKTSQVLLALKTYKGLQDSGQAHAMAPCNLLI